MTDCFESGVGKYHRKGLERGISTERQSAATFRYRNGIKSFQNYMEGVKVSVQQLGLPLYVYQAASSYAKQVGWGSPKSRPLLGFGADSRVRADEDELP